MYSPSTIHYILGVQFIADCCYFETNQMIQMLHTAAEAQRAEDVTLLDEFGWSFFSIWGMGHQSL